MNNDKTVATAMQLVRDVVRTSCMQEREPSEVHQNEHWETRAALESFLRTALAASGSKAARDVLAERQRQVSVEGWTPEHDDEHGEGEMAQAAAVYANPEIWNVFGASRIGWPWDASWYKPRDPRSNYVRAAALLLAEIERLDRAAPAAVQTKGKDDSPSRERTCDIPAVKDAGQAAAGHMRFYREMMGKTPQTAAPAAQPEPVWIQPDHLAKARMAPFLCRIEPSKRDDFVPLYTASPPPAAQSGNDDAKGEVQYKCTVSDNAHPGGIPLEQWQREAAMRGALAKKG